MNDSDSDVTLPGEEDGNCEEFDASSLSDSSQRCITYLEKIWSKWLASKHIAHPQMGVKCELKFFFTHFKDLINDYLPEFFSQIRKNDGRPYPPKCLRYFFFLMQMKIKDLGLPINLKKDKEFEKTRSALDELVNNLIADGHDPPRRSAAIVTSEMEAELYEKGVLGDWNPYILLQTVYFIIGKHFSLRSRDEHRSLIAGEHSQIKLRGIPPNEIILFEETLARGSRNSKCEFKKGHILPTGEWNCPVRILKFYLSKLPKEAQSFYCKPCLNFHTGSWYLRNPIGKNNLASFMRHIAGRAGWDMTKLWTGHSLRELPQTISANSGSLHRENESGEDGALDLSFSSSYKKELDSDPQFQPQENTHEKNDETSLNMINHDKVSEPKKLHNNNINDVINYDVTTPRSPLGAAKDENTCPVDLSLTREASSPLADNSRGAVLANENEEFLCRNRKLTKLEEDSRSSEQEVDTGNLLRSRSHQNSPANTETVRETVMGIDRGPNVLTGSLSSSLYPGQSASLLPSLIDRFLLAAAAVQNQPSTAVAPPKKFKCQKCNAAFKCKETLDGHNQSYCPMRKQPSISPVTSLASNGPINGVAGGSVVGGNNLSNKNHVRELTSLVAQQSSSGDDLLEKVHQQLSSLENVVMATKTFETQQRLGIIPGPVGNVRKHKCSACGIMFSRLDTLQIHKEKYCAIKPTGDDALNGGDAESSLVANSSRGIGGSDNTTDDKTRTALSGSVTMTPSVSATSSAPLPALAGLLECAVAAAASASVSGASLRPTSPQTLQRVLATRKRRSPNTENDQDFKPYAKFQCRSCHVKFIHETTLKAHEQNYCTVRQTVANYESHSPPQLTSRNSGKVSVEMASMDYSPKSEPTSPEIVSRESISNRISTNQKVSNISPPCSSPGVPQQPLRSHNISSLCKMCDAFLMEGSLSQHLKIFHRITNSQTLKAILDTSSFSETTNTFNSNPASSCGCSPRGQRDRISSSDSLQYENVSVTINSEEHESRKDLESCHKSAKRSVLNGREPDKETDSHGSEEFTLEKENDD